MRQGVLGSYYFHASITSAAQAAPETLREAIRPGLLGTYKVHFASGPDEMVFPADIQNMGTRTALTAQGAIGCWCC